MSVARRMIRPLRIDEYGKPKEIIEIITRKSDCFDSHDDGNRVIYVYELDGRIVGEGALVFENGDPDYTIPNQRIYISRVIVDVLYRNQGIGAKIVDHLLEVAKEKGFKEVSIGVDEDNLPARHLYEQKMGFDTVIFEGEDEAGKYLKLMRTII